MYRVFSIVSVLFLCLSLEAQVPNYNSTTRLDVGTWNIEWFGNKSNGPSNETTQFDNAVSVIKGLNLDIMSLCEISDSLTWLNFLSNIPQYQGVISTWSQTQKTALIFKKDQFRLIYSKNILSQYSSDFASGRLPLEVALETKFDNKIDTIFVWVIHLKANIGTTTQKNDAYNNRFNASLDLKSYVNQKGKKCKGLVMGDWNDDFDKSIWNGNNSPYANWRDDQNFVIPTYQLSLNNLRTTASYSDAIDHIAVLPGLKNYWVKDSVQPIYANAYIGSFSNNTSDHFPVCTRFYWDYQNPNASVGRMSKSNDFGFWNGSQWMNIEAYQEWMFSVSTIDGKLLYQGYIQNFKPQSGFVYIIQGYDLKTGKSIAVLNSIQ